MNRTSWFMYLLGITFGLIVAKTSTTPIGWGSIIFLGFLTLLTIKCKLNEIIIYILLITIAITYPLSWYNGKFHWYDILIFSWIVVSLYNTAFIVMKVDKPITFFMGDVTKIPPTFVEMDFYDEYRYNLSKIQNEVPYGMMKGVTVCTNKGSHNEN